MVIYFMVLCTLSQVQCVACCYCENRSGSTTTISMVDKTLTSQIVKSEEACTTIHTIQ